MVGDLKKMYVFHFVFVLTNKKRHETYKTQYRAMFVFNCHVKQDEQLKYPAKEEKEAKRRNKKSSNGGQMEAVEKPVEYEIFKPVECSSCKAEVGVYDEKEEIYHFFNILASHS